MNKKKRIKKLERALTAEKVRRINTEHASAMALVRCGELHSKLQAALSMRHFGEREDVQHLEDAIGHTKGVLERLTRMQARLAVLVSVCEASTDGRRKGVPPLVLNPVEDDITLLESLVARERANLGALSSMLQALQQESMDG